MKRLLSIALVIGLLTSCGSPEYIAKDSDGAPILIHDREGIIADAVKVGADSIYLVKYTRDKSYHPLRWMGENKIQAWADTINGKSYSGVHTYKVIPLENIILR
jgi:hypothetical protein